MERCSVSAFPGENVDGVPHLPSWLTSTDVVRFFPRTRITSWPGLRRCADDGPQHGTLFALSFHHVRMLRRRKRGCVAERHRVNVKQGKWAKEGNMLVLSRKVGEWVAIG